MERGQRLTVQRANKRRDGTSTKVAYVAAACIASRTNTRRKEWQHVVHENSEKILDVETKRHERLDERVETGSLKGKTQIIKGGSEKGTWRDRQNRLGTYIIA